MKSRLIRELALRALRKRRAWRVTEASMHPEFWEDDLVLIDPTGAVEPDSVIVAPHPSKNLDVIKYVEAIDDHGYVWLRSPGGDDSRQFGRVPLQTVKGVVTINVTSTWSRERHP